ncbi:UDP-glucuronosyl/UDP-glucosyltransferase [Cinara cedri]|uniref:UDP-glucuronosyltransferase n=1 Tax=Cinara cedri TaxID=506608 RepID=A0A5E4MRE9_9HEMI|nr:UDP-glucuronosyl/UDP-glucosyltransferase [Cinara cedri]
MSLIENHTNRDWTAAAVVFVLAAACVSPADNARILAVETASCKSHWNFMSAVLRALTDGGHSVTAFTPLPDGDRENYTEVDTSDVLSIIGGVDIMRLKLVVNDQRTVVAQTLKLMRNNCHCTYNDRRLSGLLADGLDGHFDAVVIEPGLPVCVTYATAGTGLPVIYTEPMAMPFLADRRKVGDVPNPAAVSSILTRHAVPATFAQRFFNALLSLYAELSIAVLDAAAYVIDPKPYDAYVPVPPSIVFTNGHYVSDAARPISPNVVNVGGIHLRPPRRLPEDILEFIENSPHGVILFTFGSIVSISSMPNNTRAVFLEVLAQLPQRTLLKYEGEMLIDKPDNVMIRKWLPQRDILVHPNVKLFVSHGGISGVYEAVDAGVPVLGFPVFSDQYRNIDNLVKAGMAISMELLSVSKDTFFTNVVELINNEKYKKNAEIALSIFKDRPMSPQQSVVYWTEYVIRHKGAPHLKSHALNLSWYQYFLLDVIAVVLILISIVSYVIYRVFKLLYQYSFKRYFSVIKENRSHRLKND